MENELSKLHATLSLLREMLGSTYRFHTLNDIDDTSPKVACNAYKRDIKQAVELIENTMKELGYKFEKSVLDKNFEEKE